MECSASSSASALMSMATAENVRLPTAKPPGKSRCSRRPSRSRAARTGSAGLSPRITSAPAITSRSPAVHPVTRAASAVIVAHRLLVAFEVGTADEHELGEQHEPVLAVGVGKRLRRRSAAPRRRRRRGHRARGASPGGAPRRRAATDRPPAAPRARARAPPWSSPTSRNARPRSKRDGVDDVRRRRLGHGALEQPRRGRQRAEPSRGVGGAPEHGHDGGIAARWSAHQVLGDTLVVQPRVGEQRGGARVQLGSIHRADRLARRRGDHRVREAVPPVVEHALGAQLLLGGERLGRPESGERARPGRVGIGAQDRDGARERCRGRAEPLEPVGDEPHELRRRAAVVERVAAGAGEQLAEIQRVAARWPHAPARRAPTDPGRPSIASTRRAVPAAESGAGSSRANARSAASTACR